MTPIKPAAALILALLLTACADSGVGGQPVQSVPSVQSVPYAEADVQIAKTAEANNATATAYYVQATTDAANANATNEAAKVTAVAQSTATEIAALDSAAAIAAMTRDAIEANTLQAEATATAVHLEWLMDYDARKAVNQQRASDVYHWGKVILLVLFAFGGWTGIKWLVPAIYEWIMPTAAAVYDANGEPIAIGKGYSKVERPSTGVDISPPEPVAGDVYTEEVHTEKSNFTIIQPSPRGFSIWLMNVLDDDTRCVFSDNERRRRGWTIEQYGNLILKMRNANWLHPTPDGRGVYTMTEYGKAQAREWLGDR